MNELQTLTTMENLFIRVAKVRNCPDGKRTDPFTLTEYKDHPIDWFIDSLNLEEINLSNHFCFLIDVEKEIDYTL